MSAIAIAIGQAFMATPLTCTKNGQTFPMDNPLGGLPFVSDWGVPDGCVEGDSIAEEVIDNIWGVDSFKQAAAGFVKTSATFWVNDPSPTVANSDFQLSGTADFISSHTSFYALILLALSIVVVAGKMAWQQRRGGFDEVVAAVLPFIIVTGIGAAVVTLLLEAGDAYSVWIIDQSATGGFADNLRAFLVNPDATASVGQIGGFILLGLAMIGSLLQMLLMLARAGALVILIGLWPVPAAAAGLSQGKIVFTTYMGWVLAFVLYKPAAATVYAGAFSLIGTPGEGADPTRTILQGVVILVLAIATLPALVKILSPASAPVAGGAAAPVMGAAVGAGAMLRK